MIPIAAATIITIMTIQTFSLIPDDLVTYGQTPVLAGGTCRIAGGGLAIVDRRSCAVAARVGGKGSRSATFITSVLGGLGSRVDGTAFFVSSSYGAERTDPSIRQKVNVSSKVRLQVGQLFIAVIRNNSVRQSEE